MQELAAPCFQLSRPGVADLLLRAGVDGRAVGRLPRVAESASRNLGLHDRCDFGLLQAGPDPLTDVRKDLFRFRDRGADPGDLER